VNVLRKQITGECLAEVLGTFVLVLVGDGIVGAAVLVGAYDPLGVAAVWGLAIMALIDEWNPQAPKSNLAPLFIGVTVSAMVMPGGPLNMAALNPARDFGPNLFGYLAGWGRIASPGPRGHEWWVYLLAPSVGGLLGGAIYSGLVQRCFPKFTVGRAT